jgi:hypothetical protein
VLAAVSAKQKEEINRLLAKISSCLETWILLGCTNRLNEQCVYFYNVLQWTPYNLCDFVEGEHWEVHKSLQLHHRGNTIICPSYDCTSMRWKNDVILIILNNEIQNSNVYIGDNYFTKGFGKKALNKNLFSKFQIS